MELHQMSIKDILESRLCKARCLMIEAKYAPYDHEIAAWAADEGVDSTENFISSLEKLLQDIVKPRRSGK